MISDDELLLYFYRDGLSPERALEIQAQLQSDKALQLRWHRLQAQLEALPAPEVPLPELLQERLHALLTRAAKPRLDPTKASAPTRLAWPWHWSAPLAATILLTLGIVIGARWQQPNSRAQTPIATQLATTAQTPPAAAADDNFARSAQLHLLATERGLAQVTRAKPAERAALVLSLLESNRLHAHLAERAGDGELARLLRSFDAILRQMGDSKASADDLAGHRAQLAFELEVMQTKRQLAASKSAQSL
jgi:hypothetical protein